MIVDACFILNILNLLINYTSIDIINIISNTTIYNYYFRVLKPPGGGSSDIFGGEMVVEAPRATKNHMRSNIFSEPEPMAKNGELNFAYILISKIIFIGSHPVLIKFELIVHNFFSLCQLCKDCIDIFILVH